MIISDGLTWPAIVAGAKSCTRRDWQKKTAERLMRGDYFKSYHNAPFAGGIHIATCRVTIQPLLQSIWSMDNDDWAAEGFEWLHKHPWAIPPKARREPWGKKDCAVESFYDWRLEMKETYLYVIRYEIEEVTALGYLLLSDLKRDSENRKTP